MRWTRLILPIAAMAMLGGCDRLTQTEQSGPVGGLSHEQSTKLQAYHAVVLNLDLAEARREYEDLHIDKAKATDTLYVASSMVESAFLDFNRAQAMPGALEEPDATANALRTPFRQLVERLKGLDSYFRTRGQLADDLARGRAEDRLIRADFDATMRAYPAFAAAVEKASDAYDAALLPGLKAEGRMASYHQILTVRKAKQLVTAIDSPEAAADPVRIAQADRIVAELGPMLQQVQAARVEEARKAEPAGETLLDDGFTTNVEMMIGSYRDLVRSQKRNDHDRMMQAYAAAALWS